MTTPLLEVNGVTVAYRSGAVGVRDVSLRLGPPQVVCIIGPNGAGKTSTVRAIAGFERRDVGCVRQGSVLLDGTSIDRLAPRKRYRAGVVFIPERDKIFRDLTIRQQLRLVGRNAGDRATETGIDHALALFPDLRAKLDTKGGYLSGGQRQMAAIATALCAGPRMLVIDELTLGLSPIVVRKLAEAIREIADAGMPILMAEQSAALALDVADELVILDGGRTVFSGTSQRLRGDTGLSTAYLGTGAEQLDGAEEKGMR